MNSLPVEVLSEVVSLIKTHNIGYLIQCGNNNLTHKLLNGGIRRIQFYSSSSTNLHYWPRFFSDIACLEDLSLVVTHFYHDAPPLEALPRSITSLSLSFSQDIFWFESTL